MRDEAKNNLAKITNLSISLSWLNKVGKPSKKFVCKYMDTSQLSHKLKEGSEREAKLLKQCKSWQVKILN